jgi:hypothetical protein
MQLDFLQQVFPIKSVLAKLQLSNSLELNAPFVEEFFENSKYISRDDYMQCVLWSYIFTSQIDENDFKNHTNLKLKSDSANCKFAITSLSMNGKREQLFLKFVAYPTPSNQDSLLADTINGHLINVLARTANGKNKKYFENFMTYCDAFLFYEPRGKDTLNLHDIYINLFDKCKMKEYTNCQVAISSAVNGFSLGQVLSETVSQDQHPLKAKYLQKIIKAYNLFLTNFTFLGLRYGLMHNDLHLRNLLYDVREEKIVCIDYGRLHFGNCKEYINDDLFVDIMRQEYLKLTPEDRFKKDLYEALTGKYLLKSSNDVNLHIADYMTLAGNMYLFYLATCEHNYKIIEHIKKFFDLTYTTKENLNTREGLVISFPNSFVDLTKHYNECARLLIKNCNDDIFQLLYGIIEGLYLISVCLLFFHQLTSGNTLNLSPVKCDLNNNNIFYSHFQVICGKETFAYFMKEIVQDNNCSCRLLIKARNKCNPQTGGRPKAKIMKGGTQDELSDEDLWKLFEKDVELDNKNIIPFKPPRPRLEQAAQAVAREVANAKVAAKANANAKAKANANAKAKAKANANATAIAAIAAMREKAASAAGGAKHKKRNNIKMPTPKPQ